MLTMSPRFSTRGIQSSGCLSCQLSRSYSEIGLFGIIMGFVVGRSVVTSESSPSNKVQLYLISAGCYMQRV